MRRCSITSSFLFVVSPTRALYHLAFRRGHHLYLKNWLRRKDLNPRPLAYGAIELPDCSTAQFWREGTDSNRRLSFVQCRVATARHVSRERSNRLSYPLVVFRLPFVKERRYYRIHHLGSQWQKYTLPFVVGRAFRCGGMNRDFSRSQRNQLEFAIALASEDVSVGSMVAVILLWRSVRTMPK